MRKKEDFKTGLRRRYLAVFDEVKAKNGMTEKDLCKSADIPASYIHQLRSGKRSPTLEQVVKLCEVYNYDLLYVIRGDDKVHTKKPSTKVTLEDVHREVQELKEVVENLLNPMIEGTVRLVKENNPLDPKEWVKKIGKQ